MKNYERFSSLTEDPNEIHVSKAVKTEHYNTKNGATRQSRICVQTLLQPVSS